MKLKGIRARGFQSHTDSYIPLAPGLTVITGESGDGKTSGAMRAPRWLALGEPSGDGIRFKIIDEKTKEVLREAEQVEVTLEGDDGVEVTKIRRNDRTKYILSTIAEPFAKAEVPQEVTDWLGIKTYSFGDFQADLNFAYQLGAPFLISESASAGAKVLGKLAGTEIVDLAVKDVTKEAHAYRTERAAAQKELERIDGQLAEFDDLTLLEEQLQACEYLVEQITTATTKAQYLGDLKHKHFQATYQIAELGARLDALAIVNDLAVDLENIEKAQRRYDRLLDLYSTWGQLIARIDDLADQLAEFQTLGQAAVQLDGLEGTFQRLTVLKSLHVSYQKYTGEVNRAAQILAQMDGLPVAESLLHDVEERIARKGTLEKLQAAHKAALVDVERFTSLEAQFTGLGEAADVLKAVENAATRLERLRGLQQIYLVKKTTLDDATRKLTAAENDIRAAKLQEAEAWAAAGGICPLCEQPHKGGSH